MTAELFGVDGTSSRKVVILRNVDWFIIVQYFVILCLALSLVIVKCYFLDYSSGFKIKADFSNFKYLFLKVIALATHC